jgi:hypothetical protein
MLSEILAFCILVAVLIGFFMIVSRLGDLALKLEINNKFQKAIYEELYKLNARP